ncbi:MAG: hypothetical protein KAX18_07575 [Candidatus Lokiarchaeota archaeon]|nr:hypothetical protein [Candidatus Lokiarchaeota archaeon]
MTNTNEITSPIESISIRDIGNLSIVELILLQKLLRHGRPVVRHVLFNEVSQFLISEQSKVVDSINSQNLPAGVQKFQQFLKSEKKFSSSSFYYSLYNLEGKGLIKFNRDKNSKVESVEATKYTEILNSTILKHIIKFGILIPEQDKFLTEIIKEAIKLIEEKKFGTLLYIWLRDFIKVEFMNTFSTITENLFILSREETFEKAAKFGLNNIQHTALFNDTIREPDNFFDAVIIPYHFRDKSLPGMTKQQILKEAFRIIKSNGVVIIHGFVPIPNIDHGILNIFVKWVKEIYKGLVFYTEEEFKKELLSAGANNAETFLFKGHLFGVGRK